MYLYNIYYSYPASLWNGKGGNCDIIVYSMKRKRTHCNPETGNRIHTLQWLSSIIRPRVRRTTHKLQHNPTGKLEPKQAKLSSANGNTPKNTSCSPSVILHVARAKSGVTTVRAARIFGNLTSLATKTSLNGRRKQKLKRSRSTFSNKPKNLKERLLVNDIHFSAHISSAHGNHRMAGWTRPETE